MILLMQFLKKGSISLVPEDMIVVLSSLELLNMLATTA